MANRIIWGSDLYKGFKLDKNKLLGGAIDDILPFQMLTLEQKTADWIKAVADYYETAGWANVERKAGKIQRNYWMRYGKLNPSDYIVNPTQNEYYQAVGWIMPPESKYPLEQFYALAPNFVDVLRGEFIKRDNTWTIEVIDDQSKAELFSMKQQQFEQVIMQAAALEKQMALANAGITEESDPEGYGEQMEQLMQQLTQVEFAAKNFRTTGAKWAEKVLKIHEKRYNLHELEPDGFESGLISDREFWHLDLMDDDFKVELLNPKWCDYHKGPNVKYVSDGDYFLWFDFMSAGDIVNKFGRKMKEEDILKLRDIYVKTSNIIVPDYLKSHQGSYYDLSKNWLQSTDLDPKMNDALLGKELAYNFMRSPNFEHNMEVDILNPIWGRKITGHPQMFRVMRLYWRSLKRIGWLTKIERDGSRMMPDWVDENFKVTVEPEYDTSVVKDESKDNLIYGEHIDWTWVPEWRHVIKISPNQKHTFWLNSHNTLESIYIDGGPVKFQFKGRNNPFDSLPPVEGCEYSYLNTDTHAFMDRIRPLQILYNIAMNKVPKKILKDYGNKIAIDRRSVAQNNLDNTVDNVDGKPTVDPMDAYEDMLLERDFIPYSFTRESLEGLGQPALPQVLPLSTVQEAQLYFSLAQNIKWEAGELIGITRQRVGGQKASETAFSVQQGIQYSETQTEKYFEQHSNLMQRVRQRMLDASQYYSTFHDTSKEVYMNEKDENVFLEIEGMENTFPHYNLYLTSRANTREVLRQITDFLKDENTLDILPSAKISAMAEKSVHKLMELVRRGEVEAMEQEQIARDHSIQVEREKRETLMAQLEAQQSFEAEQNELDRQKDIDVASIRALGGIQTDADASGDIDAQQNLDAFFRNQELADRRQADRDSTNAKRQSDIDKMNVEREKAQKDLEKEKIKGQYALKVAKENKTAAEMKKRASAKKKKK
jgi:hypothetical protein